MWSAANVPKDTYNNADKIYIKSMTNSFDRLLNATWKSRIFQAINFSSPYD